MIRFNNDYSEVGHPRLLRRLLAMGSEQNAGYGQDSHSQAAAAWIRRLCEDPGVAVHFISGGTQTNLTVISAALRPHQGVLCAATGHIHTHETGSIEATGHAVLPLPAADGKITAAQIESYLLAHYQSSTAEHTVQPGMVYLSQPTELGTVYNLAELTAIADVCHCLGLYLFVDGARLAYALAAEGCDVTLPDLVRLCDVFYMGGTKAGALFGEAVVISHPDLQRDFRYLMKQRGALLAKGFLLGIQFEELLQDGLYFELGRHGVRMAMQLQSALRSAGFSFLVDSPTNQQFVILPDTVLSRLADRFSFEYQQRIDALHSAVRFCTSWATRPEDVQALVSAILSAAAENS